MNGKEIYSILQEHFPDGAALSWDNVGLFVRTHGPGDKKDLCDSGCGYEICGKSGGPGRGFDSDPSSSYFFGSKTDK